MFSVEYSIRAQFTSLDPTGWIDKEETQSKFSGERNILIFRPMVISPSKELKCQLTNKTGGFLGISKTSATTEIIFENNEYYVGDKINVKIICNNSSCSKAVKEFKLKLYRFYSVKDENGHKRSGTDQVEVFKAPGCPAKTKVERDYTIKIPTMNPDEKRSWGRGEFTKGKEFSASVQGQMFTLEYTLICYVKHDAWNDLGKGNRVMLPIKIMQKPIKLRSEKLDMPIDWKPQVQPEVHVVFPVGDSSSFYHEQVILPKEKEWAKNARPSVVTSNEFKAQFEAELKKPVDEDLSEIGHPIDTEHVFYVQNPLLIG